MSVRIAAVVLVGCLLAIVIGGHPAYADRVADEAAQLTNARSYKRRLAAVLALSQTDDDRAVAALTRALGQDTEAQIRRSAALGLARTIHRNTPRGARDAALAMLAKASRTDRDAQVRELAAQSLLQLDEPHRTAPTSPRPGLFVVVNDTGDKTRKVSSDTRTHLTRTVRRVVSAAPEVSTEWPGRLPTARELTNAGSRAFAVTATVSSLTIERSHHRSHIRCSVSIQVGPWTGTDGAERWVAGEAATASGSGDATTGTSAAQIAMGIRDCVLAVGEQVTATKVMPFLKRFARVSLR